MFLVHRTTHQRPEPIYRRTPANASSLLRGTQVLPLFLSVGFRGDGVGEAAPDSSEDLAHCPLRLLGLPSANTPVALPVVLLRFDRRSDRQVEQLTNTDSLFGAAFNIHGTHVAGHGFALLRGHGCEALCAQQFDAGSFVSKVGFQANEDKWCSGTEVEDLGIPLPTGQMTSAKQSRESRSGVPYP